MNSATVHHWAGLAGQGILLAALALFLLRSRAPTGKKRWLAATGLMLLSFVPLPQWGCLACVLRGLWGDVSLTTLQLAACAAVGRPLLPVTLRRPFYLAVSLIGLGFYPLALGLAPVDPYRLGWQPLWMLLILAGLTPVLWRWAPVLLVILGVDVLAFALGLLESRNLWDYLLDPLLFFYALGSSFAATVQVGSWGRPPVCR
jgi:hypothetical protein